MRLLLLPDIRDEIVDDGHLEDLEAFNIEIEDLITYLINYFPGIYAEGEEDFREIAQLLISNRTVDNRVDEAVDLEALICLVQETLNIIYPPFKRVMRIRKTEERWVVVDFKRQVIIVRSD